MPTLRLAYATQFLIAVIAVFTLWGQVGGQNHLDLMPWWIKLGLGAGTALAVVKATMNAVSREPAWNAGTLKWFGIALALLLGCGLSSYYVHMYGEGDEQDEEDTQTSSYSLLVPDLPPRTLAQCRVTQWLTMREMTIASRTPPLPSRESECPGRHLSRA
jgi:hypothetical protein